MTPTKAIATPMAPLLAAGLVLAACVLTPSAWPHGGQIEIAQGPKGPLHLSTQQIRALDVRTAVAGPHALAELLQLNGQLRVPPGAQADAASRIAGQVVVVYVQVGDTVRAGQRLLRVQSRLVGDPPPSVDILAPRGGVVQTLDARVGQGVEPGVPLVGLGDPTRLAVLARVYEEDLGKVRVGQPVVVTTLAFPGERLGGRVQRLGPVLDPDSRTVAAWIGLDRADPRLRPNLFARVGVVLREDRQALAVPTAAVIEADGTRFVFVRQGNEFARVPVRTGPSDGQFTQIDDGLVPGDVVVVQGAGEIYTQWLSGGAVRQGSD
ncbi:MAG: efflux RND transporter periplasmic adaptor subunit [Proteobacteria bacterium]|nr:efflux RND transporter periplasmic adaptor subunit [Pseudomonadota bacterium]